MKKTKLLSFLQCLVIASLAVVPFSSVILPHPAAASTTNYYVDGTYGLDTNSGTSTGAGAWKTIGHAASIVTAGAIVNVAPGTYTENNLELVNSGTSSDPIKYVSTTRWGATIQSTNSYTVLKNDGDYVTIDGFVVIGDSGSCLGIANWGGNTKVINNHVHDIPAPTAVCGGNGGAGIDDANFSKSNADIIGNYVHDIGTGTDASVHGIYHSNSGGHIMNNVSFHNSGWGIHLWHAATAVVVSNNTTFNNKNGGIIFGAGDSPGGVIADNIVITNNIAANNTGNGITEYAYSSSDLGSNNKIYNNIVYNNSGSGVVTMKALTSGNITADPQFLNYTGTTSGDYHLGSTSPGLNSGTSLGAPSYDYEANPRAIGAGYDIGAYESKYLLLNPSFEAGSTTPTGWSSSTSGGGTVTWDTTQHKEGAKSIKVVGAGGTSTAQYYLSNRVPVIAGKSYTLNGYYKSSGIGTANYTFLKITWYDSASTYISGSDAYANLPSGSQSTWTLTTVTKTAPVGAVTAMVQAYAYQNTGTAWFDSVALIQN